MTCLHARKAEQFPGSTCAVPSMVFIRGIDHFGDPSLDNYLGAFIARKERTVKPAPTAILCILIQHCIKLRMHHVRVFSVKFAFKGRLCPWEFVIRDATREAIVADPNNSVESIHNACANLC